MPHQQGGLLLRRPQLPRPRRPQPHPRPPLPKVAPRVQGRPRAHGESIQIVPSDMLVHISWWIRNLNIGWGKLLFCTYSKRCKAPLTTSYLSLGRTIQFYSSLKIIVMERTECCTTLVGSTTHVSVFGLLYFHRLQ